MQYQAEGQHLTGQRAAEDAATGADNCNTCVITASLDSQYQVVRGACVVRSRNACKHSTQILAFNAGYLPSCTCQRRTAMQMTRGASCISAHGGCPPERLLESASKEALHLATVDAARTAHQYFAHGVRCSCKSVLRQRSTTNAAVKRMPGQYFGHMTAYLQCLAGQTSCMSCCSPKFGRGCLRVAFIGSQKHKVRYDYIKTQTSNKEGFTHPL